MKSVTLATSIGCILLLAVSSAQARTLHHSSHRHMVVEKNIVHKSIVVRATPIRSKLSHLTTVRLAALPAGFVRLPSAYTRVRIGTENLYRYNNTNYRKENGFFIVV